MNVNLQTIKYMHKDCFMHIKKLKQFKKKKKVKVSNISTDNFRKTMFVSFILRDFSCHLPEGIWHFQDLEQGSELE